MNNINTDTTAHGSHILPGSTLDLDVQELDELVAPFSFGDLSTGFLVAGGTGVAISLGILVAT